MILPRRIRMLAVCLAIVISVAYAKSPKKIIKGELARAREFPHLVSLQQDNSPFCVGSIIDATTILTAAHCLDSFDNQKRKGVVVVTGTNDNKVLQNVCANNLFPVAEIIVHCRYNSVTLDHDIAILKLAKSIPFNDNQKPIRLPTRDDLNGKEAIVAGWGAVSWDQVNKKGQYSRFLQKTKTTIISMEECEQRYKGDRSPITLTSGKICALATAGSGFCYGDGGSPLTNEGEIIGISSHMKPCAIGYPDGYTRVIKYLPWIKNIMARGY